jgi:hypothetical protein
MAPIYARGDFIMIDLTAFTDSDAALLHRLAEPLVVVH